MSTGTKRGCEYTSVMSWGGPAVGGSHLRWLREPYACGCGHCGPCHIIDRIEYVVDHLCISHRVCHIMMIMVYMIMTGPDESDSAGSRMHIVLKIIL